VLQVPPSLRLVSSLPLCVSVRFLCAGVCVCVRVCVRASACVCVCVHSSMLCGAMCVLFVRDAIGDVWGTLLCGSSMPSTWAHRCPSCTRGCCSSICHCDIHGCERDLQWPVRRREDDDAEHDQLPCAEVSTTFCTQSAAPVADWCRRCDCASVFAGRRRLATASR
jgi:hypothetical protein